MTEFPATPLILEWPVFGMPGHVGVRRGAGGYKCAADPQRVRPGDLLLWVGWLYYFLHSPFLALMEILIYVGAVCVTIVFAVMLAEPDEPAADRNERATARLGRFGIRVSGQPFCRAFLAWLRGQWSAPGWPGR